MNDLEMILEIRKEIHELREYTDKRVKILLVKLIQLEKNVNKES